MSYNVIVIGHHGIRAEINGKDLRKLFHAIYDILTFCLSCRENVGERKQLFVKFERSCYVFLIAFLPFFFMMAMALIMESSGVESIPFSKLLTHPMALIMSAAFPRIGARLGLAFLIKDQSGAIPSRVRSVATGVTLAFVALSIVYIVMGDGVVNPVS